MKYRKKPVVVEAEQFSQYKWLPFLKRGDPCNFDGLTWYIQTLEGDMAITEGDWIIKGIKGEFYPCKDDIFRLTYEPVEEGKV